MFLAHLQESREHDRSLPIDSPRRVLADLLGGSVCIVLIGELVIALAGSMGWLP